MKRSLLLALSLSLALNACMPAFLPQVFNPTPTADAGATAAALPSATALPSSTLAVAASTETLPTTPAPTLVPTQSPTLVVTTTPSFTPMPVTPSASPTLGAMFFGTLPPLVPSGRMIMINRSHAEAYVSFQCINKEGTLSILEYPVGRWSEVRIPAGKCKYVAWVGGRQFNGSFSMDTGGEMRIIFFKERVTIKQ